MGLWQRNNVENSPFFSIKGLISMKCKLLCFSPPPRRPCSWFCLFVRSQLSTILNKLSKISLYEFILTVRLLKCWALQVKGQAKFPFLTRDYPILAEICPNSLWFTPHKILTHNKFDCQLCWRNSRTPAFFQFTKFEEKWINECERKFTVKDMRYQKGLDHL